MDIKELVNYLQSYDGKEIRMMEVCGSHTSALFKNGIRTLISPKIKLISGPGCPVCVTPTSYIDQCIDYAKRENHIFYTFGDMLKVPGCRGSLSDHKGQGARVEIMYSPLEVLEKAKAQPQITHVVGAVGFETTVPAYALLLQESIRCGISNIKLVTALKTIIPALEWICDQEKNIDGFICPGHVSVIIGSEPYGRLQEKYQKPFVVAGFEGEHLLSVIYDILRQTQSRTSRVDNLYREAVKPRGNAKAREIMEKYFEPTTALWRGLGRIPRSGLSLRPEFASFDGGSRWEEDQPLPPGCGCGQVIMGDINPDQCDLFGSNCTPVTPYGPCMVSAEGACGIWYRNKGGNL